MSAVKEGDRVEIKYVGKMPDGEVFDQSEEGSPLAFTAGGQEVIPGVSNAVLGMNKGESKTVEIPPDQAYGEHKPGLEQRVPADQLPPGVQQGQPLKAMVEDQEIIVWITELGDEFAVIDANHPLAGRTLVFDLEVVSVNGQ